MLGLFSHVLGSVRAFVGNRLYEGKNFWVAAGIANNYLRTLP